MPHKKRGSKGYSTRESHSLAFTPRTERRTSVKSAKRSMAKSHAFY